MIAARFGYLRRVPSLGSGDPVIGVNVAGYLAAELGVGEAARLLVRVAENAGVPVATFTYGVSASRQADPFVASGPTGLHHDVSILCVNANETPRFVETVERAATADKYRIGFWYWEIEEFPARFHDAFDHVDEVWVASEFTRAAIARHSDKPVSVFPLPIAPGPPSFLEPGDLGLDGRFLFACCWDALSVPARKNPTAAIDAYVNAFDPGGDTRLLVKSVNGDRCPDAIEELRSLTRDRDDVTIVDGYWPRHWMTALVQLAGCYVSLHRAEGFGLNLAAAAAEGKPVIATGYSGNLEFMLGDLLVPFTLVPVGPGRDPYPADAR
ncbi:MAG: glycosyltransferase, partial [Acidimicrobiia bacterium]